MKESIVVHIGGEEVKTSDPMTPEMKTIFEHLARPLSLAFASPHKTFMSSRDWRFDSPFLIAENIELLVLE